jgi:DNA-binding response OmpR family regulator
MSRHSLLIVDADPFLAGIYAHEFEKGSFDVFVAESVEQAKQLLEKQKIEVVIIDPDTVDLAWEFLRLKKLHLAKRLILTQLGQREEIEKAQEEGVDAYLLKGHFVPSEICKKVLQLL